VTNRPVRGMIVEVDLDPVVGHEQGCARPCIVVQNNAGNRYSSMTIVVPLTDAARIGRPSAIYALLHKGDGGIRKDSIALTDQIRAVDLQRLGRSFGVVSPETMMAVDRALLISLGLARGGKA
jgi:mRNA interferase MazF